VSGFVSPSATYLNRVLATEVEVLSCRDKKVPKEALHRSARHLPPFLAPPGARPTRRALNNAPRARTRSRLKAPGGAVVLGARYGDVSNPPQTPWQGGVFQTPLGKPSGA